MNFSKPQRGVASGWRRPCTYLITRGWPPRFIGVRLLAAACVVRDIQLAPTCVLAVCIGRLASHRFMTPEDIDGGGLTPGSAE